MLETPGAWAREEMGALLAGLQIVNAYLTAWRRSSTHVFCGVFIFSMSAMFMLEKSQGCAFVEKVRMQAVEETYRCRIGAFAAVGDRRAHFSDV